MSRTYKDLTNNALRAKAYKKGQIEHDYLKHLKNEDDKDQKNKNYYHYDLSKTFLINDLDNIKLHKELLDQYSNVSYTTTIVKPEYRKFVKFKDLLYFYENFSDEKWINDPYKEALSDYKFFKKISSLKFDVYYYCNDKVYSKFTSYCTDYKHYNKGNNTDSRDEKFVYCEPNVYKRRSKRWNHDEYTKNHIRKNLNKIKKFTNSNENFDSFNEEVYYQYSSKIF